MKAKKLTAFLLAFSLMLPTIGVTAEEYEPTSLPTEVCEEESVDEPAEEIIADE